MASPKASPPSVSPQVFPHTMTHFSISKEDSIWAAVPFCVTVSLMPNIFAPLLQSARGLLDLEILLPLGCPFKS